MEKFPSYVNELAAGHPVKVYFEENNLIEEILTELLPTDPELEGQKFFNLFNQLCEVEKKFARKENQLFPYLEKYGWTGPSQGMWAFHDQIREELKQTRAQMEAKDFEKSKESLFFVAQELSRLFQIEELRLFPNAMELLNEKDWKDMYEGDEEIGWMFSERPAHYPAKEDYVHPSEDKTKRALAFNISDSLNLDEGHLNEEQINLLLKFMPVDLTYVDENDRVLFYNRGEDRVFPRSAGIIGREVRFCHPPKSVDTVLRILEEFKSGNKDEAEFWINFKGRVIHIRYFALRNKENKYKGVIEMSQDITEIQKLTGQQRLLDWD